MSNVSTEPMPQALVTGATGLVGRAALKHFASQPDCDVLALSRRRPDDLFGAQWQPLDLADQIGRAHV